MEDEGRSPTQDGPSGPSDGANPSGPDGTSDPGGSTPTQPVPGSPERTPPIEPPPTQPGSQPPAAPLAPIGSPALPEFPGGPVTPVKGSSRGRVLAIVVGVVLVLAMAAAATAYYFLKGSSEQLLQAVPQNSVVVATVNLDPGAGQKVNLLRLANKFPVLGNEQHLSSVVQHQLDTLLQPDGLSSSDVLPWIGPEVGFAVQLDPTGSTHEELLVATKDESASRAALQKQPG